MRSVRFKHWRSTVPTGTSGKFSIERFTVSNEESQWSFMRERGRGVSPGEYTKLVDTTKVFDSIWMSDTFDELNDQLEPINKATGHVLINGLGLGCVLQCCIEKESVESVTVVEIEPDVIKLVAPHFEAKYGDRLKIICADAFQYKPEKGVRYDVIWHDIWHSMCLDNLPEMHRLHRKYGRVADWQGSWSRKYLERLKRGMYR
jgi:predicted methyltransferase